VAARLGRKRNSIGKHRGKALGWMPELYESYRAWQNISPPGRRSAERPTVTPESLRVPWLSVRIGAELALFDEDHFLAAPWSLAE
jgi:hypothetical protein